MSTPLHTKSETLGARVKRLRTEREMSQEKLADFCGVTNGWISKLEKDKYWPSPELITNLSAAFKIPVHELLQEEDKRMEVVSRIKLIEVLLERNKPFEAESYILEVEGHPELTTKDKLVLRIHYAECLYQQAKHQESLLVLIPIIEELESTNHHDAIILSWVSVDNGCKISNING
ncbi:helix-turn-helix domain-containing protein [Tumebacillus permanentifrigoris]|uniref:DNA-binding XRE family transcriptional regulator n=1 Tax=Tumebacillus permanentifrigoris TaxID=378543 RepID=A0A316D3V9_9BACL|nr:helix-turn-helix transcriptional regulator [Tumebacillus permanentifrigoris]PWK05022.1 DNA-binding XRE family transcriptional regulator [Tumebacillus permanentifrigoris]